jgi:hypothetical protein
LTALGLQQRLPDDAQHELLASRINYDLLVDMTKRHDQRQPRMAPFA